MNPDNTNTQIDQTIDSVAVESTTTVKNVHGFVEMPGTGRIYKGQISMAQVGRLIAKGTLKYAPGYQRGFKKVMDDPAEYEALLPLTQPVLQIKTQRSQEMAVKYLRGELFSATLIWNARKDDAEPAPKWDSKTQELNLYTELTVPDTAHRHLYTYWLLRWKKDPDSVPKSVTVNDLPVSKEQILNLLEDFEPARAMVFVEIYNLAAVQEGWLYDQFNFDARKPDRAVGIKLNSDRTPSRRFIKEVMRKSAVLSAKEVEERSSHIGKDARKLVSISTLVGAAEESSFKRLLAQLEAGPRPAYDDLVDFATEFFSEYAKVFVECQPGTDAAARAHLREETFAIDNIMFHPLFRLAKDLWDAYRDRRLDWRFDSTWKRAIATLDQPVTLKDGSKVRFMSRRNPAWIGKVLIATYGAEGLKGYIISNTRQTREAAYRYLLETTGLSDFVQKTTGAAA